MKNYGLKLDAPKPEDYIFGGGMMPYEVLEPDGDWSDSLPVTERQDLNGIEPSACVTFTVLNCVEMLIKKKYGITVNYSDRFLASISGTKEGGNSPQVVCEFLRKIGVVPEEVLPFDSTIDTFDKFYAGIPASLIKLAEEFKKNWDFTHEYVPTLPNEITKALRSSPLLISVSAWFKNHETGLYERPPGMVDNHATTLISERIGEFRRVFDSYGDPYIKDIRYSDMPMQIKRFHIEKRVPKKTLLDIIKVLWQKLLK